MPKEIRNKQDLQYSVGSLVYINHNITQTKKHIHKKVAKHLDAACIVLRIVEKESFDSWHNSYQYFVYEVLVGNEKLEFSEDVLTDKPVDRDPALI